jgi:pimeloyl-ACP methyl ester carboxylesterase
MKQYLLRFIMVATILAMLITACTSPSTTPQLAASTSVPITRNIAPEPMSHGLVDVGGRNLWFQCVGYGTPTVILEAGGPDDSSVWFKVQSNGDQGYRVCSYDRANLGLSDEAPKPRTFVEMARDLHTLLVNARIDGPYILVGHSMGGSLVRVFRAVYPEEVVGLVLVDSAHPDMGPRLLAGLPQKSLFESKAIRIWRKYLAYQSDATGQEQANREGVDFLVSNEQVRVSQPLGDLPLVVISRSPANHEWPGMPTLPAETMFALLQIWQDLQSEMVGLSSNSTQMIATHASHMIPTEEPKLVIEAIRNLVSEVRSQMGTADSQISPSDQAYVPVILRVEDRPSEQQNGGLILNKEIIFSDEAGDAIFDLPRMVSADPPGNYLLTGGFIPSSSDEQQKGEAGDPLYFSCPTQGTFVEEVRIIDQAFNQSEPVQVTFTCPAFQDSSSPWLMTGLVAGLVLLVVIIWMLVRYRRSRRPASRLD